VAGDVDTSSPILANNKARADMRGTWNNRSANGNNGADVALGATLSAVFNAWDTAIWDIPASALSVNGALPTLKNMPEGMQNPRLP